jgi:acetyltransferase
MMTDPTLIPFFVPRGVAIIGASLNPTKLGYGLCRNLVQSGYQGAIHFVNIKGGSLMGFPVYPQISDIPDPVDLVFLLIPAKAVPQAIEDCALRGIKALIVGAGGFRETGALGAELETLCVQIARENGARILGPNCIGVIDTHLPIDSTFLSPPGPTPGDIAFISHSGAICAAVIDWARGQGFGLSRMVSLGNQADVTETDLLAPVAEDPHTRVITMYLEGISEGRDFLEQAQAVSKLKPVVAIKVGRFESGRRAVASHTGALAGRESAYNAAFRRAGVIRADTTEQLFDWARALAWCPLPGGKSVGILTNAGGPGVTAVDSLESQGLKIARLSSDTQAELRSLLDPAASVNNPVDMLADATPQQFASCLQVLLSDSNVDSVMVILPPPPMHTTGGIAKAIIPVIYTTDKPVGIEALAVLSRRSEYLKSIKDRLDESFTNFTDIKPAVVESILANYESVGYVKQEHAYEIINAYGIQTTHPRLATTPQQAVEIAQQIGFPVAMKIASPEISHKSDFGGVLLNLEDAQQVEAAFSKITDNNRKAFPEAEIYGNHVQQMFPAGQDVIIGAVQDPQFGSLVMFGTGGTEVEGLKDVQFSLAPLTYREAVRMLEDTWAGNKLIGYRDLAPADREAVIDALLRLAQLASDHPQIAEIEINPLRALDQGKGAYAIDVRLGLRYQLRSKPSTT